MGISSNTNDKKSWKMAQHAPSTRWRLDSVQDLLPFVSLHRGVVSQVLLGLTGSWQFEAFCSAVHGKDKPGLCLPDRHSGTRIILCALAPQSLGTNGLIRIVRPA